MGVRIDRGLVCPVVRSLRVLGETPESVDAPRRDLLLGKVVAGLDRTDQVRLHSQEQGQVLPEWQQRSEPADDLVVHAVNALREPAFEVSQGDRLVRSLEALEEKRTRSAPEAQLKGRPLVEPKQPSHRPGSFRFRFLAETEASVLDAQGPRRACR